MEQGKINQLNSAKTTVAYCETTAAETASNTTFAPKVVVIKGKIVVVEGFIQLSNAPFTGVTLNVKAIRAVAIENVLPLGSAVFAYAASQTPPDQDLMAQSKITKSRLEDISKEECFNECQRIYNLANTNSANILPLGITALMLTDAGASVTLFGNVINDPRAAQISRSSAGEQAELTLASIMEIDLRLQLDPMADIFRFSKNVWWRAYKASREVIDLGTTFTKLRASCEDINGVPLKDVTVSLLQAGVVIRSKKTDIEGKVSMVKVKPGNYDIKFEKAGYDTIIETDYHFAPGSEKIHHVTLLAAGSSGTTIIRQGSLNSPGQHAVDLTGVNGTPESMVIVEVLGPAGVRFGAAANATDPPGPVHYDKETGSITMLLDEFIELCGFGPGLSHLIAQNIGMEPTSYRLTFTKLEA